ncbi:MAG: amidohydrolase [Deltaproteobacteria bacterium]|nr:amidohydrolase [Deltaproteobacteria bacterium]MBT4640752.1 amidohydrolase [Deltaproteobacteria bacterium]MBT6500038.1 amidohydrolase [Deltaproteobacteria bacterium]MBT7714211.1 amidohydrolase [Deltaproteobacteria bacterium]
MNSDPQLEKLIPEITNWRHQIHAWPETAFEEIRTSEFVAEKLASFGLKVETGIAKTGVIGTLQKGSDKKSVIGLRADMDGLDIQEENDLPYRSENIGKMHACGHDGHTAMLLGAAKRLSQSDQFNGTVHFIFQPAEENEGGASVMVREGLFKKFPVQAVFGLHNFPVLPLGYFAITAGPMMAAFDIFDVTIKGRGGHAAMPHQSRDPIMAASYMINQFQSIVSRNLDPIEGSVISVTQINGGTAYNIIPDDVHFKGTTRHFQPHIQDEIEARMREIVAGVSKSMDVKADFSYERRYPSVINSLDETQAAINAAKLAAGDDKVMTNFPPVMGSEDFAFMLHETPGAYIGLGAGDPRDRGMLHQSRYDFNDELLPIGVTYWESLVKSLLPVND